ncbi:triose-phosphate isomerase [Candidatus Heimdallarchaeota archaeon B3_Heim]|nr:MAG: triose-phosphate isomerase [Candidatus Heimdallarchaeota archaeon B3_Heim]
MRRIVIGGNWKMQITSNNEAVRIADDIAQGLSTMSNVDVFIAPSFTELYSVSKAIKDTHLMLAGQNMYYHEKGAFTGQISVLSLKELCQFVILGHSEPRRIFGETDDLIRLKLLKALESGLTPVLCLGETAKEREGGKAQEILHQQLAGSLKGLEINQMKEIVIAYEPVWAINNKFLNPDTKIRPATPVEANEAHTIIREWLNNEFGAPTAEEISIIYGGSMNAQNAKELLNLEQIDGGLIGGASLSAEKFLPIIRIAAQLSENQSADYRWENNTLRFDE